MLREDSVGSEQCSAIGDTKLSGDAELRAGIGRVKRSRSLMGDELNVIDTVG
jgi:hypothetical protein